MAYNIQELLSEMVKRGASDLHITAGSPPLLRISGKLTPVGTDKLKPDETMRMTYSLMNEMQKKTFEQQKECDDKEEFLWFARYIQEHSKPGQFYGRTYHYCYLGKYKYWMMDERPEDCDLINRDETIL